MMVPGTSISFSEHKVRFWDPTADRPLHPDTMRNVVVSSIANAFGTAFPVGAQKFCLR